MCRQLTVPEDRRPPHIEFSGKALIQGSCVWNPCMDFVYRFCVWIQCMESRHTVCRCCRCDWELLATCRCGAGNQRQGAASSGNRWLDDGEGSHTGSRCEARQNKRHHSKQHQHGQIDTTRNWIPAGYILAKCALLQGNSKQDLGANQQTQRKTSSP